jgi:DNA polymerase-4
MMHGRRIAHLDMDAFFASVELLSYPELRGHAVVVGGRSASAPAPNTPLDLAQFPRLKDYAGRGVVTTSTYEARALGVFSGMGLMKSALLAPDAILLPANFEAYRHYSQLFKRAVAEIAPAVEDRGIDEIYIDLSDHEEDSFTIAKKIKARVFEATGLNCSIGISPNKLLSKICSDLDKPNGLTILPIEQLADRIWPLPAKKINGIGPKANEKLGALGIVTVGELAAAAPDLLIAHFGRATGMWMHEAAHGIDNRPVVTWSEPKSISRETTFERDLHPKHDRASLSEAFTRLCSRLSEDLTRKGYVSKTIGIKIKFSDFQVVTRDITLTNTISSGELIRNAATECLKRVPLEQRIRLLGVRASNLASQTEVSQAPATFQASLPFS